MLPSIASPRLLAVFRSGSAVHPAKVVQVKLDGTLVSTLDIPHPESDYQPEGIRSVQGTGYYQLLKHIQQQN